MVKFSTNIISGIKKSGITLILGDLRGFWVTSRNQGVLGEPG